MERDTEEQSSSIRPAATEDLDKTTRDMIRVASEANQVSGSNATEGIVVAAESGDENSTEETMSTREIIEHQLKRTARATIKRRATEAGPYDWFVQSMAGALPIAMAKRRLIVPTACISSEATVKISTRIWNINLSDNIIKHMKDRDAAILLKMQSELNEMVKMYTDNGASTYDKIAAVRASVEKYMPYILAAVEIMLYLRSEREDPLFVMQHQHFPSNEYLEWIEKLSPDPSCKKASPEGIEIIGIPARYPPLPMGRDEKEILVLKEMKRREKLMRRRADIAFAKQMERAAKEMEPRVRRLKARTTNDTVTSTVTNEESIMVEIAPTPAPPSSPTDSEATIIWPPATSDQTPVTLTTRSKGTKGKKGEVVSVLRMLPISSYMTKLTNSSGTQVKAQSAMSGKTVEGDRRPGPVNKEEARKKNISFAKKSTGGRRTNTPLLL